MLEMLTSLFANGGGGAALGANLAGASAGSAGAAGGGAGAAMGILDLLKQFDRKGLKQGDFGNMGQLGLSLLSAGQSGQDTGTGLLSSFATSGAMRNMFDSNQQPNTALPQTPTVPAPSTAVMQAPPSLQQMQGQSSPINNGDFSMENLKQVAMQTYPNNPVMQKVALAQAIQESGLQDGTPSSLAGRYNNLFGIKKAGTAGVVNLMSDEYKNGAFTPERSGFGANKSVADSFTQHRDLLSKLRYQNVLAAQSPLDAFNQLQKAGYATDPKYAHNLSRVYNQYVSPLYN